MDIISSSTTCLHYPDVEEDMTPKVGMHFDNLVEVYEFYNTYVKLAGFSVRKDSTRTRDGEVLWKRYFCSKEGKTDEKHWKDKECVQRRRMETRENCKAQLQIKKNQSDGYIVSKFVPEHSHAPATPHKRFMLRSHREVSESKKQLINTLDSANIRSNQQMVVFGKQSGGLDKIGFTDKDAENHRRNEKEKKKGLDGHMLYQHFENRKEMSPGFVCNIERDGDNKVTHVFWANHTFRTAYSVFGDVVTFDTTYKTNCYGLIFGAFVGCNHHGQTTLFGCAFLPNEKTESFEWLFNKWLEAMLGGPPRGIITYQDLAMTKAIQKVMPNSTHRYCLWHILDKLPTYLGGVSIQNEGLMDDIKKCVHNSDSPADFECEWKRIITEHKVADNEWLTQIFKIRDMWVPAFLKDNFFAGMSTTSRSESMNAFVKHYVEYENTLLDFILRFEQGVERLRYLENKEDYESSNGRPKLKAYSSMEKQMAEVYTRNFFYKFQDELFMTMSIVPLLVSEDDVSCVFTVKNLADENEIEREVSWKKEEKLAFCSCKKFEFQGIPCRHVLSVMRQFCIRYLPDYYILRRWTKKARIGTFVDKDGVEIGSHCADSFMARHNHLSCIFNALIEEASSMKECYDVLVSKHAELQSSVPQVKSKDASDGSVRDEQEIIGSNIVIEYYDPPQVTTKGSAKRLKSSKEKATKGRLCRGCNKRGVSHDKRNCPILLNRLPSDDVGNEPGLNLDSSESSDNSDTAI